MKTDKNILYILLLFSTQLSRAMRTPKNKFYFLFL